MWIILDKNGMSLFEQVGMRKPGGQSSAISSTKGSQENKKMTHSIRSCDTKLAQLILDEIIEGGSSVTWEDISGQEASDWEKLIIVNMVKSERFL